jgi:hypothetical protein
MGQLTRNAAFWRAVTAAPKKAALKHGASAHPSSSAGNRLIRSLECVTRPLGSGRVIVRVVPAECFIMSQDPWRANKIRQWTRINDSFLWRAMRYVTSLQRPSVRYFSLSPGAWFERSELSPSAPNLGTSPSLNCSALPCIGPFF